MKSKCKNAQLLFSSQTEYARFENGRFVYRINRSPMCEYMINFIHKLKHLPEKYMMNSVLENFTILLVTIWSLLCFDRRSHEAGGERQEDRPGRGLGQVNWPGCWWIQVANQQLNSHIHRVNPSLVWAQVCRRERFHLAGVSKLGRTGNQEGNKWFS